MARLINVQVFKQFFKSGSAGGILLIGSVVLSLCIANTEAAGWLQNILDYTIGYENSWLHLNYPVLLWINDGLMAVFFLLVGLEIKRELVEGELSNVKKASLPILAAFGGAIIPAVIFIAFNRNTDATAGWGIPMATDIAFALAIIALLGKRVPASLKIFLAALAIVDDLIAILVIALFYSTQLHLINLLFAGGLLALLVVFNKAGVKHLAFYIIPGLFIWYFIHHSGIHATIAGVLVAFTLPTNADNKTSPLEKLEHGLLKPVNFLIMPLFALANTNITIHSSMFTELGSPLSLGIIAGLFIGKPVGILLSSWLAVKTGIARLPEAAGWKHIMGVGIIGGIGFTMSIFIALLSFPGQEQLQTVAKFSVLVTSITAGIVGYIWLKRTGKGI
jgi:NhaA family Na+:H+ antiporter